MVIPSWVLLILILLVPLIMEYFKIRVQNLATKHDVKELKEIENETQLKINNLQSEVNAYWEVQDRRIAARDETLIKFLSQYLKLQRLCTIDVLVGAYDDKQFQGIFGTVYDLFHQLIWLHVYIDQNKESDLLHEADTAFTKLFGLNHNSRASRHDSTVIEDQLAIGGGTVD